jgi:hypothetical protein
MSKDVEYKETLVQSGEEDIQKLIPSMNLNLQKPGDMPQDVSALVSDTALLTMMGEVAEFVRKDRDEIDQYMARFADMVFNEGDPTTSSKEALVNLIKMKSDTADKMSKVLDLMTRIKLKEKDTFPRYLAAHQNNTINIGDGGGKRALLEAINKAQKDKDSK